MRLLSSYMQEGFTITHLISPHSADGAAPLPQLPQTTGPVWPLFAVKGAGNNKNTAAATLRNTKHVTPAMLLFELLLLFARSIGSYCWDFSSIPW